MSVKKDSINDAKPTYAAMSKAIGKINNWRSPYEGIAFQGEPPTQIASTPEWVDRRSFGDTEQCGECTHALECMTGNFTRSFMVAATRRYQRDDYTLFCIDGGKVKLVAPEMTTELAAHMQRDNARRVADLWKRFQDQAMSPDAGQAVPEQERYYRESLQPFLEHKSRRDVSWIYDMRDGVRINPDRTDAELMYYAGISGRLTDVPVALGDVKKTTPEGVTSYDIDKIAAIFKGKGKR